MEAIVGGGEGEEESPNLKPSKEGDSQISK